MGFFLSHTLHGLLSFNGPLIIDSRKNRGGLIPSNRRSPKEKRFRLLTTEGEWRAWNPLLPASLGRLRSVSPPRFRLHFDFPISPSVFAPGEEGSGAFLFFELFSRCPISHFRHFLFLGVLAIDSPDQGFTVSDSLADNLGSVISLFAVFLRTGSEVLKLDFDIFGTRASYSNFAFRSVANIFKAFVIVNSREIHTYF